MCSTAQTGCRAGITPGTVGVASEAPQCQRIAYLASTTVCRASAGTCDVAENCTGSSDACPADVFQSSSTTCRASAGVCDVAETCTGSSALCPTDAFRSSSTVCRASANQPYCDPAESCTGSSASCPADVVTRAPVTEACNGVDDNCNGSIDETFPTLGTSCTVGVGACTRTGTVVCGSSGSLSFTTVGTTMWTVPVGVTSVSVVVIGGGGAGTAGTANIGGGGGGGLCRQTLSVTPGSVIPIVVGAGGGSGAAGGNSSFNGTVIAFGGAGTTTTAGGAGGGGSGGTCFTGGSGGSFTGGGGPYHAGGGGAAGYTGNGGNGSGASGSACINNATSGSGGGGGGGGGGSDPGNCGGGYGAGGGGVGLGGAGANGAAGPSSCSCGGWGTSGGGGSGGTAGAASSGNGGLYGGGGGSGNGAQGAVQVTFMSSATTCSVGSGTATTEVCNGIDDDCDGTVDEGSSTACASAIVTSAFVPGNVATYTGYVPATVGAEQWYVATFVQNADYNSHGTGSPTISLAVGTGDASLRMEIRYGSCAAAATCVPGTAWTFTDNQSVGGGSPTGAYSTRNVAWPTTVYIRLYRTTGGSNVCSNYTLTISR